MGSSKAVGSSWSSTQVVGKMEDILLLLTSVKVRVEFLVNLSVRGRVVWMSEMIQSSSN